MYRPLAYIFSSLLVLLVTSCSPRRFLQADQTLLQKVSVTSDKKVEKLSQYKSYVRQHPNTKWFSLLKVPTAIYCLSSTDSVRGNKGFSKWLRRMGEAPAIYDPKQTALSIASLEQALMNEGYLHASCDTVVTHHKYKTRVRYNLHPQNRYYIEHLYYHFESEEAYRAFQADSAATLLRRGMPLNLNRMAEEKRRILRAMADRGFYGLHDGYISFDIDTLRGSLGADVTLHFVTPPEETVIAIPRTIGKIRLYEDVERADTQSLDSTTYRDIQFFYKGRNRIRRRIYASQIPLNQDSLLRETDVRNSYVSLGGLPAIKQTTVRLYPMSGDTAQVGCDIHVIPAKPNSFGFDVEGTNTAGDLGAAASVTYSNRNVGHGSELLTLKLRAAYEAITGLEEYSDNNFIAWSAEMALRFPTLRIPFARFRMHKAVKATSEAKIMYDSQDRPEFHRRVLTGSWGYRWYRNADSRLQHRLDAFQLNYVYMPWISGAFRQKYLEGDDPHYSVLRSTYENLLVMKTSYSLIYNSMRDAADRPSGIYQTNGLVMKSSVELAGNLLYAYSRLFGHNKDGQGKYTLFGINYSQYVKFDFDVVKSFLVNSRNSFACHAALGIGIPYGNSDLLPYEKRYFAGGANSVRGWSVRELGPGSYRGEDGKVDFINQTGNLKLDLSAEWRTQLFGKLHGAFFIDAGNIWNTRSYPGLEAGTFRWHRFWREIAVAYGLGLRLNFDYFILRFDGGMKAINPQYRNSISHYPLVNPKFSRDFTFHFAVGLPF